MKVYPKSSTRLNSPMAIYPASRSKGRTRARVVFQDEAKQDMVVWCSPANDGPSIVLPDSLKSE